MDLLEQPMEAVALHLYSLPEVVAAGAAAWTCLAAVLAAAAAAGVWRLRSSTPAAAFTESAKPLELDTSPSSMSRELERSSTEPTSSSPEPSPKERYTAYYHDSGCVGCCVVESDEEEKEEEEMDTEDDDGVFGPWEKKDPFVRDVVRPLVPLVVTAAADEMGRYRSPRAVGGSVVRLWDQGTEWGLTAEGCSCRHRLDLLIALN